MTTFASLRFLQASEYPRKKDGSLYSPEFKQLIPHPSSSTSSTVVVVPSTPSTSKLPTSSRPLPTPPSSRSSSFSDSDPSSSDDHLGSFPSLLAFFASERKIVKQRDKDRRRSAAEEKAARKQARGRATLRYPKIHDLKIKEIVAKEQRIKIEHEERELELKEGEDGADQAADDEDGPMLFCGSIRFASMSLSPSNSTSSHSSRTSRGTYIDGLPDLSRQDWPLSPARTTTTSTPSPLSSSFTPVVPRRRRAAKAKLTIPPPPSSSVPTSPTINTARLPSTKPKSRLLPFTLLDPSTPPPSSPGASSQLRNLAERLSARFPEDKEGIEMQLKHEDSIANGEETMKITRDDASRTTQVHVFVDQ